MPFTGDSSVKINPNALKIWKELGPLNVLKLVEDEMIQLSTRMISNTKNHSYSYPVEFDKNMRQTYNYGGRKIIACGQHNEKWEIEGLARVIDENGGIFEGEWKNGRPNGFGRYIYGTTFKYFYMGYFNDSKHHGYGIYSDSVHPHLNNSE